MRNVFLILTLLLFRLSSYGQTILDTDGLNNLNNVYLFSLKEYCKSIDPKTKIIYVMREHFIGENWPKEINGLTIRYLPSNEYKKVIKENNGNVTIVRICGLELRNGKFSVGLVPFSATYSRRVVHLSNGGGLNVNFEYNSDLKGLLFKDNEWIGI